MKEERIWPRPQIIPLPRQTMEIERPVRSLNEAAWKICRNPGADFWREEAEDVLWEDTVIPMQQSASSEEYAYACDLEIPEEWAAGRIFLRFDGVNCLTRVFVDGNAAGRALWWLCELGL